ncbi:MAG: Cobalt-zinc-cadmium resistance protein CzcC precursor [Planctomycetes bacterium ADurb.Bin412]|nr:MAG: Cobalt-zinc-cadmium resistance protein CzcC precursor [Planctomycetes bacterium ADurb.Bin412]
MSPADEPNGILSLGDVFARILLYNPTLAAYSQEIRAQEALALQSSLLPNPELEATVEDFGGSGATRGFDTAETTIQINQLIQLAGKRNKQSKLAGLDTELVQWDYQSRRLDLFAEAAKAYVEVLAAQEQFNLAGELNTLAQEVKNTVQERVSAGKESPPEALKAEVSLSASRVELENVRRRLDISRTRLAGFWGSIHPDFLGLKGNIYDIRPHGSYEDFAARIAQNPDLARWTAEQNQRQAALALEKARTAPDITVSAGTKYYSEPGDTAFIVGVAIPLPLFDRNQGNISAARARLEKSRHLARESEMSARTGLAQAYTSMLSAYDLAVNLRDTIIPAARQSFAAAREGYQQGKFGYLDLLDAQRTLFQVRQQYLDILLLYHQSHTDIERLAGGTLDLDTTTIHEDKQEIE